MKLPQMVSNVNKSKKYIVEFGGINKSNRFREGELGDSLNLSSDLLPYISQRGKRAEMEQFESPTAIHAHNGIAVVDGTKFLYKAEGEDEFSEKAQLAEGRKQIAQLGNTIVIYPDILSYNTGTGEARRFSGSADLAPSTYVNAGEFWPNTYVYHNKITTINRDINGREGGYATQIYKTFKAGDMLTRVFAWGYQGRSEKTATIDVQNVKIKSISMVDDYIGDDNKVEIEFEDYALFKGDEYHEIQVSSGFLIMETPGLQYVCAAPGRVWGVNANTIYASAYNSPTQFKQFDGLSSDSYSINVSTPGPFTGCAEFTSHLVFFKENYIHCVYGNRPSNYSMVTINASGVQNGCYDSIKMLNGRLFYKGVDGIYMYSGGMPVLISEGLGTEQYIDAVAGVQGNKYYISMKNSKGEYELFSYDTIKGVFLKEDNTQLIDTTQHEGKMLYIDSDGKLMAVTGNQDTEGVEWSAELREFNETVNEKKGYSRITLRIELDEKAYMNADLAMDNGRFELVKTVSRPGKNIVNINIPPNRCDSFRLRLSGKGGCRVMNMVREFITGSEVR